MGKLDKKKITEEHLKIMGYNPFKEVPTGDNSGTIIHAKKKRNVKTNHEKTASSKLKAIFLRYLLEPTAWQKWENVTTVVTKIVPSCSQLYFFSKLPPQFIKSIGDLMEETGKGFVWNSFSSFFNNGRGKHFISYFSNKNMQGLKADWDKIVNFQQEYVPQLS